MKFDVKKLKIAVVGLGYVGLPLAVSFGKKNEVIGFDINKKRIEDLKNGFDKNNELSASDLKKAKKLVFTNKTTDLKKANFFITAVPTPVDNFSVPDFSPLVSVSELIGKVIKKGDIVVYESTVYPGATEEICVPVLEKTSGLKFNEDFFVGYSPERISPADKSTFEDIVKVTSGSTEEVADFVDKIYASVVKAGTYKVSSLKVAEACKVIENSQRDLNIGFMNEVSQVLNAMDVDTKEVFLAMQTKWNALPFVPGLVGGHCIGVDPYYLIHKAWNLGYEMDILRNVRFTNDNVPKYIVDQTVLKMAEKKVSLVGAKVLLMGLSFKENCPDLRNSRSANIGDHLEKYGLQVDYYDPIVDSKDFEHEYGKKTTEKPKENAYDVVLLVVAHKKFKDLGVEKIKKFGKENSVFCDIKSIFDKKDSDFRL